MKSIKRVLLVDDDPMTNLINEKIIHFTKGSSKVGSYLNPGKALDYLKKLVKNDSSQFPNVLFLDINMPEKNAWQFFDELKKVDLNNVEQLQQWLFKRSELDGFLSENLAHRYIGMTCNTADEEASKSYLYFIEHHQKNSNLNNGE